MTDVEERDGTDEAPDERQSEPDELEEAKQEHQGDFPYDLKRVRSLLEPLEASLVSKGSLGEWEKLYLGFDLGTTNTVLVALNEKGRPLAAEMESSGASVRDGVVVDYLAAINAMRKCVERMQRRLGRELEGIGAAAYPPGISERTARVCANVVESLGFRCEGLYEEPTAASDALLMSDGAIVDIGGGTTGISILRDGKVVYSADEPTGGTHMTLVLAGSQGMDFDRAEMMKRDIANHPHLVPLLRPTLEKMATIVKNHLMISGYYGKVPILTVGGGAALPGAEGVLSETVGLPVYICPHPLMVTPAGIAARLWRERAPKRADED
ncbi:MAG: ethanolamine utilization protein EutJ [Synergistaceae bacterium]|jgi:ethanolamine utilization protein EutJ|nr:ethanolamine utilization protein EutJ [Synergistaceae bacterium]